jgi:hypothetical protein
VTAPPQGADFERFYGRPCACLPGLVRQPFGRHPHRGGCPMAEIFPARVSLVHPVRYVYRPVAPTPAPGWRWRVRAAWRRGLAALGLGAVIIFPVVCVLLAIWVNLLAESG